MNRLTQSANETLAHIVTGLAGLIACVMALALPVAYFLAVYTSHYAEISAQGRLAANTISQLASRNPELWVFENARISGLLAVLGDQPVPEHRIVMALHEHVVADQGDRLARPTMSATSPIYDSGVIVGYVTIQRSQQRLIIVTGAVGVLAALLGMFVFAALRSLPMRLLHRALAESTHLATHDTLTGLPNRALFQDRMQQLLEWSRREAATLAVLCLDLDHFKEVNDSLGHAAGDRLLTDVAGRLRACLRACDTLARLGGDEFAVLQPSVKTIGDTERLAQRIIGAMEQPFDLGSTRVSIGVSIGIALRGAADTSAAADAGLMLQEADVALYRAKDEGRRTYRFFAADMNLALLKRRALEADMLEALAAGQFVLHYQAQHELIGRRIVGAEALIRWYHPRHGEIGPEVFVPVAEYTGLILRIGEWVLREACRQAATWPALRHIAVNVSPVQFRKPGFVDYVQRVLQETRLAPQRLEIEITEGVLMQDTDDTLATLRRLHSLGVAIAMDDFGTGYSSLGYLQRFHFDKIKIDRSFIRALPGDPHAAEIVRAVLRMSHAMGIRVNAEGVEHEAQANLLRDEGCEEAQGFLFSHATPPDAFGELLQRHARRAPESVAALA